MQTQDPNRHGAPKHPDSRGVRYDTDLIKSEGERLLSAYLGRSGRVQGTRLLWDCPRCGKEKISLQPASGAVGCWNAGCEVPDGTDVLGLIAHLEGLQTRGEDFKRVSALCYDLLGLPAPDSSGPNGVAVVPAPADKDSAGGHTNGRPLVSSEHATNSLPAFAPERRSEAPETTDRVLRRLLELCPMEERDERFLDSRGVALATAQAGRFGSISADRAAHVVERLEREFGRGELLNVPGFREDVRHGGRLGFTLWGDFLLIPYLDDEGRVVTIEGRAVGEVPKWAGKYTSLRNGGNHLYVFPDFRVEDLVAICEGPMGAIVAAQEGIPVGSIQGVKRYTAAGGHAPLPELAGVDFGGRGVLYVPDADVKPEAIADVEKHSPKACEWLIAHQNGVPRITTVPDIAAGDGSSPKDLDEWILAAPGIGYYGVLQTLYSRSAAPEEWRGVNHAEDAEEAEPQIEDKVAPPETLPEAPADGGDSEDGKAGSGGRVSLDDQPKDAPTEDEPSEHEPVEEEATGGEAEPAAEAVVDTEDTLDAFDRWHAVVEGRPGAKALVAEPRAYSGGVGAGDGAVPSRELVEDWELEWAGLLGTAAALALWYFLGACIGWLPGPFGWLPDPPDLMATLGGIPVSLAFGAFVVVVVLLHLRGRRLAKRRHLLGTNN